MNYNVVMKVEKHHRDLIQIENFLSDQECSALIEQSEKRGFEKATVNVSDGSSRVADQIRNNDRVVFDDPVLANEWFIQAEAILVKKFGIWQVDGLNERFRFYRYDPGQRFAQHTDESFVRTPNEVSWYTFMVYLNSDYAGGRTRFDLPGSSESTEIQGQTGDALVFNHALMHEGQSVESGRKYVLRTDVMYRSE